jgi:mRNA interferase MazF
VTRGEIYRTSERTPERGDKPGFYVVVSRGFIAQNDDVATVICAPVYSRILGISTEVVIGDREGLPRTSAVRCDFLTLMFKSRLTTLVGALGDARRAELDRALAVALDLPVGHPASTRAAKT